MLYMATICSPIYFQIVSCMKLAILNTDVPLRQSRTLHFDYNVNLAEEVSQFYSSNGF